MRWRSSLSSPIAAPAAPSRVNWRRCVSTLRRGPRMPPRRNGTSRSARSVGRSSSACGEMLSACSVGGQLLFLGRGGLGRSRHALGPEDRVNHLVSNGLASDLGDRPASQRDTTVGGCGAGDRLNLCGLQRGVCGRAARPGRIGQSLDAVAGEPSPPGPDGIHAHVQLGRDPRVRHLVSGHQHDPGPEALTILSGRPRRPAEQQITLGRIQDDGDRGRNHHAPHSAPRVGGRSATRSTAGE